jgi:hypothetical protein
MPTIGELGEEIETLIRAKKAAADTESYCNKEIERVQQQLLDAMADEHLPMIRLDSGMTLFKRCEKYYGVNEGYSKEDLINALANCDMTRDLVAATYNANTLKSRMAEIEANGDTLPAELLQMLKVTEKYKVGHRS